MAGSSSQFYGWKGNYFVCLSVRLSVCLICLFVYFCLFVCPSLFFVDFFCPSLFFSCFFFLSVCLSACLSPFFIYFFFLSVLLFTLFVSLFLCACLPVCLSVCLSPLLLFVSSFLHLTLTFNFLIIYKSQNQRENPNYSLSKRGSRIKNLVVHTKKVNTQIYYS